MQCFHSQGSGSPDSSRVRDPRALTRHAGPVLGFAFSRHPPTHLSATWDRRLRALLRLWLLLCRSHCRKSSLVRMQPIAHGCRPGPPRPGAGGSWVRRAVSEMQGQPAGARLQRHRLHRLRHFITKPLRRTAQFRRHHPTNKYLHVHCKSQPPYLYLYLGKSKLFSFSVQHWIFSQKYNAHSGLA